MPAQTLLGGPLDKLCPKSKQDLQSSTRQTYNSSSVKNRYTASTVVDAATVNLFVIQDEQRNAVLLVKSSCN